MRSATQQPVRRAFAAATAITLLFMIAIVIAVMGSDFARDARRTMTSASDAQLRQLLLVGGHAALQQSNGATATTRPSTRMKDLDVPLPPDLQQRSAKLSITIPAMPDSTVAARDATVTATVGPRTLRQTLHLVRTQKGWTIESATLE